MIPGIMGQFGISANSAMVNRTDESVGHGLKSARRRRDSSRTRDRESENDVGAYRPSRRRPAISRATGRL